MNGRSRRALMLVGLLLLGFGAVAPVFGTTQSCFTYHVTVTSGGVICSSLCTECDYTGPNGEDQGYFLWCTDDGCVDKVN